MKLVTLIILFSLSSSVYADKKKHSKKNHIHQKRVERNYNYSFSASAIGKALQHLLSHSSGAIYNGKISEYKKQLKIIKSNPSASFLELRLFYAHLEDADKNEKKFVIHTIKQLDYKAGKEFLTSISTHSKSKNI